MLDPSVLLFAATTLLLLVAALRKRGGQGGILQAGQPPADVSKAAPPARDVRGSEGREDDLWGGTRAAPRPPRAVGEAAPPSAATALARHRQMAALVMSVVVSACSLAGALYLILSRRYGSEAEKWAFGTMGTILGYWLNGAR